MQESTFFFLGYFSTNDIDDLMRESAKLQRFDHPNVLSLIGVCIDAGEAPYIVMPFMINGSLLTYLRKERHQFITITDTHEDENSMVCRQPSAYNDYDFFSLKD